MFSRTLHCLQRSGFLILWISLALYLFYSTFTFYLNERQFYYLRQILGLGLCISRGTATVLNVCSALVLLPLCKKLNHILYRILSELWPRLFFFWLESAKSFHMTVAATLVVFAVIHSISHFVNLWNFSRGYDTIRPEINCASYKNENPIVLLISPAGLTGVSMLFITLCMGVTSLRVVRRKFYNTFWYTHQLYFVFLMLLIIHPLSGVLKEEVLNNDNDSLNPAMNEERIDFIKFNHSSILVTPRFVSIKSQTWLWMAFPLSCFLLDLLWRVTTRNCARVNILNVRFMVGRTISLTISCPRGKFACRMGRYVLLQCLDISLLEWHPFTIVKVWMTSNGPKMPVKSSQNSFEVWIKVKGDWTESLEKLTIERQPSDLNLLVDGPFSSPLEGASASRVALCVAAGVGVTPFVTLLRHMLEKPRSQFPGRVHLMWIVRHEEELTWLADLATNTILKLREANRPDRLHVEFYVTGTIKSNSKDGVENEMLTFVNRKGAVETIAKKITEDEKATLLTPNRKRNALDNNYGRKERDSTPFSIAKEYPLLGSRLKRGRPHWDQVFGYWVHLYPRDRLKMFCCGSKELVTLLRNKCIYISRTTKTKFAFVHEAFS